jgi:Phosphate transporter family
MAATGAAPVRVPTEAPRVSPLDAANMTAGPAAKIGMGIFGVVLGVGIIYIGRQLIGDLAEVHAASIMPYLLLGLALLVALGFEFVNGFHDTANAVATVIYTHTLEPHVAVVWSGLWNFTGVVLSSGAVAFGIVSLLPVELILQVGGKAGFSMVFALLFAAIIWNLGTVLRAAGFELAHIDRLDYRRGHCEPADVRKNRNERRGLGAGCEHRQVAAALADRGICLRSTAADGLQGADPEQGAVRGAQGQRAATVLHSSATCADVHGREFLPRIE